MSAKNQTVADGEVRWNVFFNMMW